jgi:putative transposase
MKGRLHGTLRRRFVADAPDRLWLTDITEHPTREGKVYCAAVLDVYSRRIVGWGIADHLRSEVVDALEMARWRRRPGQGRPSCTPTGARNTRRGPSASGYGSAGLLGSMGRVASALDNAMMESFFGSLQLELLDRQRWQTRAALALAIFEWIEGWYNPRRRHSALDYRSPVEYERIGQAALPAA